MKVGIKVGVKDGIEILEKSGAHYCEVWFRLEWFQGEMREMYDKLFRFMQKYDIKFGLHFWAVLRGKYFPNLVYNRDRIADETEKLIQQTINIASQYGGFYVNYHPESLRLMELDLDRKEQRMIPGAEVTQEEGFHSLVYHSAQLREYAHKRNVDIYIETVPKYVPTHWREEEGRLTPLHSLGVPTEWLIEMGRKGFHLCYDIGHGVAQYPGEPRDIIFSHILDEAKQMVDALRLVHVNTTSEPLNGTDAHYGILDEDFRQNVFPNNNQFLQLIEVFKLNQEILLMPEPQQDKMIENYIELQKIVS